MNLLHLSHLPDFPTFLPDLSDLSDLGDLRVSALPVIAELDPGLDLLLTGLTEKRA